MRAFREFAIFQFHDAVADHTFQFRLEVDRRKRLPHTVCAAHSFVHGFIGEAVGVSVLLPEGVADGEPIQLIDQFRGTAVKVLQRCIFYFVNALDLANQQFRIAD